jgi:hypothetical protein
MGKEKKDKKSPKAAKSSSKSSGSKSKKHSHDDKKHSKHSHDEKKHSKHSHDEKDKKHSKKDKKEKEKEKDKKKSSSSRSSSSAQAQASADEPGRVTEQISKDDFFLLSEEFRVWLHFSKKKPFDEMTTDEARGLFDDFVQLWNNRKLSMMYYDGIPPEIRDACIKTKHKWGINLSDQEKNTLVDTSHEVERNTRRRREGVWNHMAAPPVPPGMGGKMCMPITAAVSSTASRPGSSGETLKRETGREAEYVKSKKLRVAQREHLDDVAPKETGGAAIGDRRKGAAAVIHGSAADKDNARDGLDLSEADTFGGGDDFASAKARMARGKDIRDNKRGDRLKELQDREQHRQAEAMQQLGIDFTLGKKIVIAPRNDA